MTVNQRLREFVEANKISPPDIYKRIGATRMEYSGWITLGRAISLTKVQAILELYPDLNARWFLTGDGEMQEGYIAKKQPLIAYDDSPESQFKQKQVDQLFEQIKVLVDHNNTLKGRVTDLQTIIDYKQSIIDKQVNR